MFLAENLPQTVGSSVPACRRPPARAAGWCHALLGDHRQAIQVCEQALAPLQETRDRTGQTNTWDSLGYAHYHLRQYDQAVTCYRHAIDLLHDLGSRYDEAEALSRLGETHHAAGQLRDARTSWRQALTILDELGHPDADHVRELQPPTA